MDEIPRLTVNRPSVIFDVQGRETVVIDLASGHYFRLDPSSTELWTRFDSPASAADLLASCENPDDLRADLDRIIADLTDHGLLRPAGPGDDTSATSATWRFDSFTLEEFTDLEDILGLDPIHEVDPARGWPHVAES
jgi:Coenzyme PQQ synthesis protein D (PqqD)